MGLCCNYENRKQDKLLPLIFDQQLNRQRTNSSIEHQFQFQLSNLIIYSHHHKEIKVGFKVEGIMEIEFFKKNLIVTEIALENASKEKPPRMFQIQWNQSNKIYFTSKYNELHSNILTVSFNIDNKNIEVIRINLALIVYGPYHHDIQFPLQHDHIRILFDAKISHIFQASIFIREFKIRTHQLPKIPHAHFSVAQILQQQPIVYSNKSYNIELPHTNLLLDQEAESYFQEERPNFNRPKKNTSFVNLDDDQFDKELLWISTAQEIMPSLVVDISSQEIIYNSLQFNIYGELQATSSNPTYMYEVKIPLWKILQKKYTQKFIKAQSGNEMIQIEERVIMVNEKLYRHDNVVGTCQIIVHMENQKIIEQIKYCTRTEEGIVNLAPNPFTKDIKSSSKVLNELWKEVNEIGQKINANESFIISEKLTIINQKLIQSKSEIYNDPSKVDSLMNNQNTYLSILQKLFPFLQSNQNLTMNSLSWDIAYNILHKNQFHLENLSLKGIYTSKGAKLTLKKKKDICMKYHTALCNLIKYALKTYVNSSNMGQGYSKFFALAFFRVRSFRERFFDILAENLDDHTIQRRLTQLQMEIEPKTSFNDHFFQMKIKWSQFFYKDLEQDVEFKKVEQQLESNFKNKKWFMEIGFKDQLFYNFCCFFFDKIRELNFGGSQKWKYIDGYSKVVILILNQMKKKQVVDYSYGLIKASISMLSNQHLINLLLPIICEKTSLHDFQNVQTALDLVCQYFNELTKDKTQPICSTFNQNYFFNLIRTVIGGEHFYSINRMLIIIYDFFPWLSQHGRYQIAMFLLGNSFFKLYYHWSKDIRCTFYNILLIRIQYVKHRRSAQIISKFTKALEMIAVIEKIYKRHSSYHPTVQQNLLKTLRMKIHHKHKCLSQMGFPVHKGQFQLQNLQRIWSYQYGGYQYPKRGFIQIEEVNEQSHISGFASQENMAVIDIVTPQRKKRTYSQQILPFQQVLQKPSPTKEDSDFEFKHLKRSSSTYQTQSKIYDEKGRRKRKPSVFIGSYSDSTKPHAATITNQLHSFSELTNEQLKNILRAKDQFKEVKDQIVKYIAKYSTCPQRNFSETNRKQMQA